MKKVIAKLKFALTNNIGIKIIALLSAAILWLTVININDPDKTVVIYNIPITITDTEVLTEQNMVYDTGISYTVNVSVQGKRSIVSTLDEGDFRATASLKELSKVNSLPVDVVVKDASKARKVTITKQSVKTINLNIEQIKQKEYDLEVEFDGNLANGYSIGQYTLYKNQITVDAPNSVLKKIDYAAVVCDVSGIHDDINGADCRVVLYDENHKKISLKKNNITLSNKIVKIDVDILKGIEIPITPLTKDNIGSPAKDCRVTKVTMSQKTVTVLGNPEEVDQLKKIDISSMIDISSESRSVTKEIDISSLFPESVTLASGNIITVDIEIERYINKSVTVPAQEIQLIHADEDYDISIVSKKISIQLYGQETKLRSLDAKDLKVTVDMQGISAEGMQDVKADIQSPPDITVVNDVTVKVRVRKKDKENTQSN